MSTRKLITIALLCAVAILLAGSVWLLMLADTTRDIGRQGPPEGVSTTI